ncbi:glutamine synthetase family protein [Streptomyces sp. NPDC048696]|uniref:glutamine synthetase family protein n=1 Tax=Streptomyces sp. NPDC048696 TaxID=3365585 RepID=UPI00371E0C6C
MATTPHTFSKIPRLSTPPTPNSPSAKRRPRAGVLSLPALRAAVEAGRVDTVMLAVPNPQGQLKGKRYGARHFLDRVALDGAQMCLYLLATDVEMTPGCGFDLTSWETGFEDTTVVPDPSTLRRLPWMPRTVAVLGDPVGAGEELVDVAPRQILRTQLARLASLGLHAQVGLETEFLLYRGTYTQATRIAPSGMVPAAEHNLDYALDHTPRLDRYLRRLQAALDGAGMAVEAIKTEGAPGQVEVTFPHSGALSACDRHVLFKHAARTLAARVGMTATFMAAPETAIASGLHLHLSLTRNGTPILPTPDGELSTMGKSAVAGLLEALPGLAPLYAPNVNSYKRYLPDSFAPTRMTWGYDNRTCAIRITGHGDGLHVEVRVGGADANPYLLAAAALAALFHGISRSLTPPPACDSNAYAASDTALLPLTLEQARSAFRHSPMAREAFGIEVVDHYARLAQIEIDHQRATVTDAERDRWFTRA